jgi:hypothetical protein
MATGASLINEVMVVNAFERSSFDQGRSSLDKGQRPSFGLRPSREGRTDGRTLSSFRSNSTSGNNSFSHSGVLNGLLAEDAKLALLTTSEKDGQYREYNTPNMWSKDYIGLYAQYAANGLIYGAANNTAKSFCSFVYAGADNTCANANSIVFFAWSLKIFFAIFTDTHRFFGKNDFLCQIDKALIFAFKAFVASPISYAAGEEH